MKNILTEENYKNAISFDQLIKALKECCKGVIWKESVAKFYHNRLLNISNLINLLRETAESILGKYCIQNYIKFITYDPKRRVISATRIRDRVLQRSLCNNGLYDAFVKPFIFDNLACQKGKGITKAIERLKWHLKQFYRENNDSNNGYYIKLDIHHYFQSTPHRLLKETVAYYIREPHFQKHVFNIIDSFKDERSKIEICNDPFGERGIGLGSQCSQLLQLLYLNDLDHYIKEQLKVKHYLRYMDDMLIMVDSKEHAHELYGKIEKFVQKKGLELNAKSGIGRISDNIQFCKIIYKLSKSGKVKTKVVRKTFLKELRRLRKYKELFLEGKITEKDLIQHGNTWYGFAKWRCSGKQIKFVRKFVEKLFSDLKTDRTQI